MYKFLFLFIYIFFFMRLYSQKNFPVINTIEELDKYLAQEKKINNFYRINFNTNFIWSKGGINYEVGFAKKFTFYIGLGAKYNKDILTSTLLEYDCDYPYNLNSSRIEVCKSPEQEYYIEPEFKYFFKPLSKKIKKEKTSTSYRFNLDGYYTSVQLIYVYSVQTNSNEKNWGMNLFHNIGAQIQTRKFDGNFYVGYNLYTFKHLPNTAIFNFFNIGINVGYNLR